MAEDNSSGAKDEVAEEVEITVGDVHEIEGKGSWAHAAFLVATTIATPAAYLSAGRSVGISSSFFSTTPQANLLLSEFLPLKTYIWSRHVQIYYQFN